MKSYLRRVLPERLWLHLRGVRSRVLRAWRVLTDRQSTKQPRGFVPGEPVDATVAVFFGDGTDRLYQVQQWLPVLERLHEQHRLVLITRNRSTYRMLSELTGLPVVLAWYFADLMQLFDASDLPVTLYVNNSRMNFHSLANRRSLHVHVSHGESDKISMASNQIKAYDRAFVAGEAAVQRFLANVLGVDVDRLVRIGRPQLDIPLEAALPPSSRRTVLYAPTWEGENDANNYTSLDVYGPQVVEAILGLPDVRLVYRPHPRVAGSRTPAILAAHRRILQLLKDAGKRDPDAGHVLDMESNILALFDGVDLLVSDVSSVVLDFLYRRTGQPILLTDRRNDAVALRREAPLAKSVNVIDTSTVDKAGQLIADELATDLRHDDRVRARDHYFDGLSMGESTNRFLAALDALFAERDRLEAQRRALANDGSETDASDSHPRRRAG